MGQHEDLRFEHLWINSEDAADGKRAGLARAVLALSNQMLLVLAVADDQGNCVRLDARRLLEAKLVDNVLFDFCWNRQLFVVPRL